LTGGTRDVGAETQADVSLAGSILMIIEFAPLIFGTAALLAVFLFFAVAEH
jgi:hypothetical protein